MISAADARRRAQESEANVLAIVERVSKIVEAEADLGKYVAILDHHHQTNDPFFIEKPPFYPPALSKLQQLIMDRVRKEGFNYKIEPYTYGVGGGLGSMDDEPKPDETGYRLVIRW